MGKVPQEKGCVKAHILYVLESQVPAFFHITTASVHDSKAMKNIPYESGFYYVFDRGYNAFKELYKIRLNESYFVVRAKKTYSTSVRHGNADCLRMCLLIPLSNSRM